MIERRAAATSNFKNENIVLAMGSGIFFARRKI
jgi:hypothetical protein